MHNTQNNVLHLCLEILCWKESFGLGLTRGKYQPLLLPTYVSAWSLFFHIC